MKGYNTLIKNCGAFFVVHVSAEKEIEHIGTFWDEKEAEYYGQTQPT